MAFGLFDEFRNMKDLYAISNRMLACTKSCNEIIVTTLVTFGLIKCL